MAFAFELKLSKTLKGACVFCIADIRGASPPVQVRYKIHKPPQSFDNFNSKAKT